MWSSQSMTSNDPQGFTVGNLSLHLPNDARLLVRPYRNADLKKVQDLFMSAMILGPNSPNNAALSTQWTQFTACILYTIFAVGLHTALQGSRFWLGIGLIFSATYCLFFYRFYITRMFLEFVSDNLKRDLADIGKHYRMIPRSGANVGEVDDSKQHDLVPSGPCGFWVVESSCEADGDYQIVGCVGLDYYSNEDKTTAELRRMCVSPDYRRRGIGGMLLGAVIKHAKMQPFTSIYLTTTLFQAPAIQLYRKYGWVQTGSKTVSVALGTFKVKVLMMKLFLQ